MLIRLDICISDGIVVRVGAVTFVTTVTICCDNNVDAWQHFSSSAMMGECMLSIRYPLVECVFAAPLATGKGTTKKVD